MKVITKRFSILLCFIMVFIMISPATANAIIKPTLWSKSAYISLGTQSYSHIGVDNKVSGAKYIFTTSNKRIVTVNSKGILSGINYGTAKITVKQVLKKKTTKIGTCKVTVKKSIVWDEGDGWLVLGKEAFQNKKMSLSDWDLIGYKVPGATYSYYSGDNKILVIKKNGTIVETKKAGKVTVTIKETYKKKTRTVGTYTLEVKLPQLNVDGNAMNLALGETFNIHNCYRYYSGNIVLETKDSDEINTNDALSLIKNESGVWEGDLKGVKEGTMTVSVYMGNEKKKNNLLGTFTVTVKLIPVTNVSLDAKKITRDVSDKNDWFGFSVEPYNCTDVPVVTSSDPSIVSIDPNTSFYQFASYKKFRVDFHKAGTVTITIKIGSISKQLKVIVTDSNLVQS